MTKRILHKLTISEISAVDRPAQSHARVAIMKRADGKSTTTAADTELERLAAALCAANPSLSRQAALHYLLHTKEGRAVFRHFTKNEEDGMSRQDIVKSLARDFGALKIAKHIVADGNGPNGVALSESEFTAIVADHASLNKSDGETAEQAFARVFTENSTDGLAIRKAYAIVKGMASIEPVHVGGADATAVNSPSAALKQLHDLAAKQRRAGETDAQAFARVYADPANVDLARKERAENRPRGVTV